MRMFSSRPRTAPIRGCSDLWKLRDVELYSSRYVLEEARFNLAHESPAKNGLSRLSESIHQFYEADDQKRFHAAISLPEKDAPILLAAIAAQADYLLTGDICHFGPHFGKTIGHVEIALPGAIPQSQAVASVRVSNLPIGTFTPVFFANSLASS